MPQYRLTTCTWYGKGRDQMTYEVIVGNIGSVYSGSSRSIADGKMRTYIEQSKTGRGRAGGENVTLLTNCLLYTSPSPRDA